MRGKTCGLRSLYTLSACLGWKHIPPPGGEGAARWAGQLDSERVCCVADGAAVMLAGLLCGGRAGRAAAAGGTVARLLRSGRCFCAVCWAAVMRVGLLRCVRAGQLRCG